MGTKRQASTSPEGVASMAQRRPSAPVAPMVARKQENTNNNDTVTLLSSFMTTSIDLAKLDLALERAKEDLALANREFANLKASFPQFPAIKERKTAAKTHAEREVFLLETRMEKERSGALHVIGTLASLIDKNRTASPTPASDEKASPARLEAIKDEAAGLDKRVGSLENKDGNIKGFVEDCVKGALEVHKKETKSVATECGEIREELETLSKEMNESNIREVSITENVNGCIARISEVEKILGKPTESLETVQKNVVESVSAIEQRMQKMEFAANEATTATELATLEKNVSALEERVLKVETRKHSTSNRNGDVPGMLSFRVPAYSDSSEGSEDEILPSANPTKSGHPKGMQLIKGRLEQLEHVQSTHTTQFNNLTTDDVTKQMVDAFSQLYPDAKNFQIAVTSIKRDLGQLSERVDGLVHRLDEHDKGYAEGKDATIKLGDDLKQMMEGLTKLTNRVEKTHSTVSQNDDNANE